MSTNSSQHVVVGAGLMGAAVAWQLAEQGLEVTLLDQSTPANHAGSSHGSARIFRYAYPDSFYTELVRESLPLWEELDRLNGAPLITPTGAVDHGNLRDPAALARIMEQAGIEHELLSADQAQARWPQFTFETEVLWHPGAGVIDAQSTVNTMVAAAKSRGAQVLTDWPVGAVTGSGAGYRVTGPHGGIDADKVIICAGGWLPDLLGKLPLPDRFRGALPEIHVRQEQAYHFPYQEPMSTQKDGASPWPTFIHKTGTIQSYGLPGGRDADYAGQKVAEFNGGRRLASASEQDGRVDPVNRQRMIDYVRKYLPGLVPEPYAETTCLFTNTPNEDFLIDEVDGLSIVSPCSGHGGKFAPLVGLMVAEMTQGKREAPPRFRVT